MRNYKYTAFTFAWVILVNIIAFKLSEARVDNIANVVIERIEQRRIDDTDLTKDGVGNIGTDARINRIEQEVASIKQGVSYVGLYSEDYLMQTLYKSDIDNLNKQKENVDRDIRNRSLSIQAQEENLIMRRDSLSPTEFDRQEQDINKRRLELDNYSRLKERELNAAYEGLKRKFSERLEYAANLLYRKNPNMLAILSITSGISLTPQVSEVYRMINFVDINAQLISMM